MKIGAPKETFEAEARVALTPDSAQQLQKIGHSCFIESGAGFKAGFTDAAYEAAGVTLVNTAADLFEQVDVVAKVRPPSTAEAGLLRNAQTLISLFYPAQNTDLLELCRDHGTTVIAMDMVPRISRAQKMDALSSMANIAGYRAVIEAGNNFGRFFTGQITAAGKVPPAKVLVIGAGVAGLAAIGTATSLGAITYAFDVRPEVAEQIESMGAQFVFLEFEPTQDGAATGGYAAPSSPEFREKQLARFRELAPEIDIVITTALIPGRPAPKLWLEDMVRAMKPGSVIVDLAAERGGNCDLTVPDQKVVSDNGVTIIGYTDFPSRMAAQASTLYSTNIRHFLTDLKKFLQVGDLRLLGMFLPKGGIATLSGHARHFVLAFGGFRQREKGFGGGVKVIHQFLGNTMVDHGHETDLMESPTECLHKFSPFGCIAMDKSGEIDSWNTFFLHNIGLNARLKRGKARLIFCEMADAKI